MNIYKQELMDHYRNPRNHGVVDRPDFMCEESNLRVEMPFHLLVILKIVNLLM